MLGVIFILGFLLAMIFPALNRMQAAMQRRQAATDVRALAEAVVHYRRVYGDWPPVEEAMPPGDPRMQMPTSDFSFGDPATVNVGYDQNLLISALTTNTIANPRRIRFIEVPLDRLDARGRFLDPWDSPYIVALDGNHDGQTALAIGDNPPQSEHVSVREPVAVFSWGEPRATQRPIRSWEAP